MAQEGSLAQYICMARSHTFHSDVRVLTKTKLGEADLIVTCLTSDGIQIRAVAKGARKPKAKLAGAVGTFNKLSALFAEGRNLAVLCEAKVLETFNNASLDLRTVAALSIVAELAAKISFPDSENPYLAATSDRFSEIIKDEQLQVPSLDALLAAFIFKNYASMGWMPGLSGCVVCSQKAAAYFSVSEGGLICSDCAARIADKKNITPEIVSALQDLIKRTLSEVVRTPYSGHTARWLLLSALEWIEHYSGIRLKSADFYLNYEPV